MPLLYLVRHGEAAAAWGEHDPNPGLSPLGLAQAAHAAGLLRERKLAAAITSPLKRCFETSAAFEMESGVTARIENGVREVPTPSDVGDRRVWLAGVMAGRWRDAPDLEPFRKGVVDALLAQSQDTAVFSHFVAINVAVAAALEDDSVTVFRPAHASITILESVGGKLRLIEKGAEAPAIDAI